MQVKLLSGALGVEIDGINLKDISAKKFEAINNLLLEHKILFLDNYKKMKGNGNVDEYSNECPYLDFILKREKKYYL
jgi:alpha-ketoglutarate-dependent taurine dioxygenase